MKSMTRAQSEIAPIRSEESGGIWGSAEDFRLKKLCRLVAVLHNDLPADKWYSRNILMTSQNCGRKCSSRRKWKYVQSRMLSQLFKHEMTAGKDVRGLQVKKWAAEIKLCLLQRPAVWCLAVEGPCTGCCRICLLLIHSGSASVWRHRLREPRWQA